MARALAAGARQRMKNRISKLQKALPEDMGAALVTSPVNRRYLTGFPSSAGALLATKKKCYLILDSRYHEAAEQSVEGCEIILMDKLNEQLRKLMGQHKVKSVGIESKSVTVSQLRGYEKEFGTVKILTDNRVSEMLEGIRAVKEEAELEAMRAAQKIADEAFLHILNYIETGRTEKEIAQELERFCREKGSEQPSFSTIIASGKNSSMPHAVPTDKQVETGDFVTMDFGCMIGGYCSDMTRTVAVGAVSARQRECYETVLAAQLASLEKIKAGVACVKVDKVARDIIDASEFKGCFGHGLGHCLGLEVHEEPRCNKISPDTLKAGMVTSVEPGIYVPGQFGVRIEDCVVVTKSGHENLCAAPKELIVL